YSRFSITNTAPTDIYTLSLHDALPISLRRISQTNDQRVQNTSTCTTSALSILRACLCVLGAFSFRFDLFQTNRIRLERFRFENADRKSTRLNSSHLVSRMPSSA